MSRTFFKKWLHQVFLRKGSIDGYIYQWCHALPEIHLLLESYTSLCLTEVLESVRN